MKPSDIGLKSDSFKLITDTRTERRVLLCLSGGQKTGKTDFGLRNAPDPIVIFNFDQGLKSMIEKFVKIGKRIIVAGVPKTGQKYASYQFARPIPIIGESRKGDAYLARVRKLAYPMWERFTADMRQFYESDARTGIIDTGTAAYNLARFAYLGMDKGKLSASQDPYGQKSGDMKALFMGLVTDAYNYDKNVIWLHREKELWVGGEPSGKYAPAGYADIAYECEIAIRLSKDKVKVDDPRRPGKTITERKQVATVTDCRPDPTMEGQKFIGKYCNFRSIMATIFDTEEAEWK